MSIVSGKSKGKGGKREEGPEGRGQQGAVRCSKPGTPYFLNPGVKRKRRVNDRTTENH